MHPELKNKKEIPVNAPLPTHRWNDAKEFIFAVIIVSVALGAGCTIYQKGQEVAAIQQDQNQASVFNSQ